MSTTSGAMRSFRVTDPNGNVYILTPVDTTARTAAADAKAVADEAAEAIDGAKDLTFDERYFIPDETDTEVNISMNGVPFGVDDETPLQIVQDTQDGLVLGADSPFNSAIAAPFDVTSSYEVRDLVTYKNKLYRCTTAIDPPSSAWDPSNWTETSVDEEINAGMSDFGNKTESDLTSGKLSIESGNSVINLTLTTVSALTVLANSGVPNFALTIDNSGNSNNVTITVKDSTDTNTLMQSVNAGNEATAGKIYQLTCVGNCWTLAEFETPSA